MQRWAIFFGGFIVAVIILADTHHLGLLGGIYQIPLGDKAGHFFLFGLLSLIVNLAVFEARPKQEKSRLAVGTSLILALFIGLEELSQIWISTRTSSLFDLTASYLGVAFFAWCAVCLKRKNHPEARNNPEMNE
jgi:VanZ family protein